MRFISLQFIESMNILDSGIESRQIGLHVSIEFIYFYKVIVINFCDVEAFTSSRTDSNRSNNVRSLKWPYFWDNI